MQTQNSKTIEDTLAAIKALDLDPIKVKLMHAESGKGWSRQYADQMETGYRRFLTLLVKYPEETIAPTMDIDEFWHYHILDTLKYAEDCQKVFGHFLHHFPYLGMRGEDDTVAHDEAGDLMAKLYQQEFNEPLSGLAAWSGAANKTAWSGAAVKTAWSGAASKTAWSGAATMKTAWSGAANKTAWSGAAVTNDKMKVTVRPTLAAAA